ncbi:MULTISPECIES: hypothetical protein [unclassified Colwellia]|uniref:hypothetical protein n=1 Tax=unclassified Colwellia TaxID=196834 RepID=UPI0015F3EC6A|nr:MULTISPECIES: hypothetical protein [unclassified Colwellia]MBA6232977.1 hypothetical protein [Colwellia sp. MB02u-7]MBA6235962.1 hypothetical protein [Colwellia sp. MB02u-11]MBA6297929.1 hypothetical protein [Colwellia sp. MB3u-22]MBA6309239.1 hypothetical protein [Colwellia sp. MB3u-64]
MNAASAVSEQKDIKKEIKTTLIMSPIATFLFGVAMSFLFVIGSPHINSPLLLAIIFIIPSILAFLGIIYSVSKLFKKIDSLQLSSKT